MNVSNFDFLKDFDNTLWKLGNRIEKQVKISPSGVKADATTFLEHILKKLLEKAGLKYNPRKTFIEQVDAVFRSDLKMSNSYRERIKNAYNYRNKIHDEFEDIEKHEFQDALQLHEKLFYIARKYYRDYNDEYDGYKGVPDFKPLEIDFTDDEVELVKVPDFNEIVDIKYDYCIICGKPNHSNYSIYCHECGRVIDNANNFISTRNAFGKDAKFTKEDLIEYGMSEGYITQFIHSLVLEDMLKVAGRFITFNNMHIDEYLSKIDKFISVGELITKFKDEKISPKEIKQTMEYKQGSLKQKPFYQFFKIINSEIITKFEKDILTTNNIQNSVEYTTITPKELERWYKKQLNNYLKGNVNESFVVFNRLLQKDYIFLKREGIYDTEIQKRLNVTSEIYEFWHGYYPDFSEEIAEIKKDLLIKALSEGKTRNEAIEIAGITRKEYDDLVKYSNFKGDEFSKMRNKELESRKLKLIEYLKHNDLKTSCNLAKLSVNDFYQWYEKNTTSDFYTNTTKILMHNFLNHRRKGKTKHQASKAIGLDYKYVEHWFKRKIEICEKFQNEHVKVIISLILKGFKENKSKSEISKIADINIQHIDSYLKLGKRQYGDYKQLYDYYEQEIMPKQLSRFLNEIKNKPFKKALEISELSQEEFEYACSEANKGNVKYMGFYESYYNLKLEIFLNNINKGKTFSKALKNSGLSKKEMTECYQLGFEGDEKFKEFYEKYYNKKLDIYIEYIINGKDENQAMKNSNLTIEELPDNIDEIILDKKISNVTAYIKMNLTTKKAAKKANVKIEDIYDWFLKGMSGDEKFEDFAELYYEEYVSPGSLFVQNMSEDIPLKVILKNSKGIFTQEDYDFWLENGFLKEAELKINEEENEEN